MSKKYRNYSDSTIIKAVKISTSLAEVLRRLNLKAVGGNYLTLKINIQRLKLNTDHFSGQGWNKGKTLKGICEYKRKKFQKEAIAKNNGIRLCYKCKRTKWFGKPIPLEVHHIDRDRTNNEESNLELLCKNCHSVIHNKT